MAYGNHPFGDASFAGESNARYTGLFQSVEAPLKKRFLWKIYDSTGTFITTWGDVTDDPSFTIDLNGGFSELSVTLPRKESEYDEGESVKYGNQLKVYAFDRDSGYDGVLIYSGVLTRYIPSILGSKEVIKITFLSYWLQTNQIVLEDAGATKVTYTAQDPTDILKDVLDKFTADGGKLDYDTGTTEDTGASITYSFNTGTYQEVLKKIVEVSPFDWYLRIGADDKVYFQQKNAEADHRLTLGKEIADFVPEKRIETITNTIYFSGGGEPKLYKKYESAGSVTAYGIHAVKYVDDKVVDTSTSDAIASRIFNNLDSPEVRVTIKVLDNSGENYRMELGYDIESFFVGQTVQILNATSKGSNKWDVAIWDESSWDFDITNSAGLILQIIRLEYTPDYVVLELSNKQPDIARRIEEVNTAFIASRTADNPDSPS